MVTCGFADVGMPQPVPAHPVPLLRIPPGAEQAGAVYTTGINRITGSWGGGLREIPMEGFEGRKQYAFNYTLNNWWAGFGLNLDNWGEGNPIDVSGFDTLSLTVRGPIPPEHVLTVQLVSTGGEDGIGGAEVVIPSNQAFARTNIPLRALRGNSPLDLTRVREIRFSLGGAEAGAGTVSVSEILFLPVDAERE